MQTQPTKIEVRDLCIGYKGGFMLSGIHFSAPKGSIIGVIGRNGSGKSTFIKTLLGIIPAVSGEVLLEDKKLLSMSVKQRSLNVSAVLQEQVSDHVLVKDVLYLGRLPHIHYLKGLSNSDVELVQRIAEELKILGFMDRKLGDISDGERQKIMIARALVQQTEMIVMDEPTAFLDLINAVHIFKMIKDRAKHEGKTWLISTHQIDLALQACSHFLIFNEGDFTFDTVENIKKNNLLSAVFEKEGFDFDHTTGRILLD